MVSGGAARSIWSHAAILVSSFTLARQGTPEELGGKLPYAIAEATLISRAQAARRIREAADLGPRRGLTGQPLPPVLAGNAEHQRRGELGGEQVAVIRNSYHQLPGWVDEATRQAAQAKLAKEGTQFRPEQLAKLATTVADAINPDGNHTDQDRARRRGLILGAQGPDQMSQLRGRINPELRAPIEAVWATPGATGMCNNLDENPCVDGTPSREAIDHDTPRARRPPARRAAGRATRPAGLRRPRPTQRAAGLDHRHYPLAELEAAAGRGLTGGGTIVPMSDVIRLARHARHYLAIFDHGKALALYHSKRLASPGQRLVLYAKDRGCSAPGGTTGGYYSKVHHVTDWATCHTTDVNDLTFGCGPHHRLLKPGGWSTRKNTRGDTEWIPPPHLDRGQPRTNTFHHPEKLLRTEDHDDDEDDDSLGAA